MSRSRSLLGWLQAGRLTAATVAAAVLALASVGQVGAATPITFGGYEGVSLQPGSACISGNAAGDASIHIVWKSSSGALKARVDMTTNSIGSWQYCSDSKRLRAGDTIKAVVEGTSRTLTMPNVSIASNRSTKFYGRGPAGQGGDIWYHAGLFADYEEHLAVSSDATGRWSVRAESRMTGGLYAEVSWTTPQGDRLGARMVTPYVKVTLGASNVSAGGEAYGSTVVKLRDPSGNSLRGGATLTFDDWGDAAGQFLDTNGAAVSVRVGDRIVSKLVTGLDWHVPDVTGSADVANDLVSGQCSSSEITARWATVTIYRVGFRNPRGFALVNTDANGVFTADFTGRPAPFYRPTNIKNGDQVTIDCYYNTGDVVAMEFLVP